MKKTKEQKRKILLTAWPDMPATHRPDFAHLHTMTNEQRFSGSKYRGAFMWPFINQEDLVKPRTLLLFMNARARSPPAEFAAADGEAMHIGITSDAVVSSFLNEHTVMFTGCDNPETYGAIISWWDHPDAFDWLMSRSGSSPGEALLILESQMKTMRFLVTCAKQILHDIPEDNLLDGDVLPAPPSVSEAESGLGSLSIMAAEAPYRPPAKLDFAHIESLLAARRDAVKDKIWMMREDPAYFSDIMWDAREHRLEMINDTRGGPHPLFPAHREDVLWARVVYNEIASPYMQLEMYTELHRQSEQLKAMQKQYSESISPEKDLPVPYMDAILKFRHYLDQTSKDPIEVLKHAFVASPPMRAFFARIPEDDPNQTKIRAQSKVDVKMSKVQQQLIWLVSTIWEDGRNLFLLRLTNVVDELQRLVESDPKIKALITSNIAALISDLSIICECIRQLDVFQPWANTYEHLMVHRQDDIKAEFAKTNEPTARILSSLGSLNPVYSSYGAPTEGRFFYPVDKRKTRETTEAMRRAEANLDLFWSKVDEKMRSSAGDLRKTALHDLLSEPRDLHRTLEWTEPVRKTAEVPALSTKIDLRPLSEVLFSLEHRSKSVNSPGTAVRTPKVKQKTRGLAAQSSSPEHGEEITTEDVQPEFAVDDRALKVFRTIFWTPSTNSTPGEVPWNDFLHAMVATGFRPRKLYGSVWHFSPSGLDFERSIHFHEPHPGGKIPYRVCRTLGRRLNRAYGWFGKMFRLAEKSPAVAA